MSASPPPASPGTSPIGPIADDASIHLLADMVLDGLIDGDVPASIVRFSRIGSAIQLAICPLGDAHPSGLLLGHRPGDECFAVGVAAHGWAYPLAERSHHDRDRTRVHLVSIVSRSGEQAYVTHAEDPAHPLNDPTDAVPSGEQVDLLRRSFELPTEPPPCGTDTYWAIEWLAAVADAGLEPGDRLDWKAVTRLHPAATLLSTGGIDPGDHDFADMITSFARVCDWPRIRTMVDGGGYTAVALRPGDGAWFDDGSIARYLLARCPPLPELRADVRRLVTSAVDRRIDRLLSDIGVPDRVWPDVDASAA